jgi:hypothetical protein
MFIFGQEAKILTEKSTGKVLEITVEKITAG